MIPIGTDYRMSCRPWVNYALVAANVGLYLLGFNGGNMERIHPFLLHPGAPQLAEFFSSMFLHAGFMHLAGNMVFLWVFGNALNDRLGHVGYLAFYLAGGVLAGLGYVLLAGRAPVLGASGAISAVTGAYLVLFPRVRVTVLAILIYVIMPIEVSSLLFLLFQFLWNLWMSFDQGLGGGAAGGVAYVAHSSGYVFGIVVALALLATGLLPRDAYDLLNLFSAGRRRSKYRRMVAQGYDPFVGSRQAPRRVRAKAVRSSPADNVSTREQQVRKEIGEACNRHDLGRAAELYLQLIQISDQAVLPRTHQLDVANQLMSNEQYPAAADAYERFLRHYPNYPHVADIHLMLGILYGRYLHHYDRAEQMLNKAVESLRDENKRRLAEGDLAAVRQRRRG